MVNISCRDETINHISKYSKLAHRGVQDWTRFGGKGDLLGIMQDV